MASDELPSIENIEDADELTKPLDEEFTLPYHLARSVNRSNAYILSVDANCDGSKVLAFGSNGEAVVYSSDLQNQLSKSAAHKIGATQASFAKCDPNLFYTSSLDGTVKLWDVREPSTCKIEFKDQSLQSGPPSSSVKPIQCFDTTPTNSILCAGTEKIGNDSYILFWDARSANLMGGYWESHSGDITSIRFNFLKGNVFASGDVTGMINIFDINQTDEDEALLTTLNCEDSVSKMTWFKKNEKMDFLAITTHSETLQVFEAEEDKDKQQSFTFSRKSVAHSIRRLSQEHVFVIDVIENQDQGFLLLAGSNYEKNKCLRFSVFKSKKLKPYINLPLDVSNRGHVRSCVELPGGLGYVTGSEGGILDLWKPGATAKEESLKSSSKKKAQRSKPY